ncbi:hypothetical protein P0082_04915 [Candidatus Haliotispira prima]|uniref:Uncharacterized protein n=1 Tax=Candidatus Haliotispira prima TaxID=3034016 RepID=A0ABY8MJK2_9SPIO|nr:hypothetical protein P0082_04915 [Candidatus Haliotispira prima]
MVDEEQDLDISDILDPDRSAGSTSQTEGPAEQDFIVYHPYPRPLLNNQPEFHSSGAERMMLAKPRLPNMAGRKAVQRRMRIIVLADIVLFIVILGVIYPSLRKIQSSGKLGGYRFNLSLSQNQKQAPDQEFLNQEHLNIVVKTEQLAGNFRTEDYSEGSESFFIRFSHMERTLLEDSRALPQMDAPVNYALFTIPFRDIPAAQKGEDNGLDIIIRIGQDQRKFYLHIPQPKVIS